MPISPEIRRSTPDLLQPCFWVGISGFDPQQRGALESSLPRSPGLPRWQAGNFNEADAWWVNGSKVRVLPGGDLRVAAGLPSERALKLNLSEVDRPVAFARPLSSGFEPLCTFDPCSEHSLHRVLLQFDAWLRVVRAQFILGWHVVNRGAELRHRVYHVIHHGNLLAVLNFRTGEAGISPRLHPMDVLHAKWERRPTGAGQVPGSFVPISIGQLSWAYVRRTDLKLLPARYLDENIYFRRAPRVPLRWIRDSQLLLLRELSVAPGTLLSLSHRTGYPCDKVENDLACLYFAGSITTTRAKATGPIEETCDTQSHSSGATPVSDAEEFEPERTERTAPALLDYTPENRAGYRTGSAAQRLPVPSAAIVRGRIQPASGCSSNGFGFSCTPRERIACAGRYSLDGRGKVCERRPG